MKLTIRWNWVLANEKKPPVGETVPVSFMDHDPLIQADAVWRGDHWEMLSNNRWLIDQRVVFWVDGRHYAQA